MSGIRLSDLQKATRELTVTLGEFVIEISYKVNAITPAFLRQKQEAAAQLAEILVSWNLVDDENEIIPVSVETIDLLPLQLQSKLFDSILSDMRGPAGDAEKKA